MRKLKEPIPNFKKEYELRKIDEEKFNRDTAKFEENIFNIVANGGGKFIKQYNKGKENFRLQFSIQHDKKWKKFYVRYEDERIYLQPYCEIKKGVPYEEKESIRFWYLPDLFEKQFLKFAKLHAKSESVVLIQFRTERSIRYVGFQSPFQRAKFMRR